MLTLANMSYLVDHALAEPDDEKRLQLAYEMLELRGPISMYASMPPEEVEIFESTIRPKYIQLWDGLEGLTHIRHDSIAPTDDDEGSSGSGEEDEQGSGEEDEQGSGEEDEQGSGEEDDRGSGP